MNADEIKAKAEERIKKIKAFESYTLALSKVKKGNPESSVKYLEEALTLYVKVCNGDGAYVGDFDTIIDIFTRLKKIEMAVFYTIRRNEAKDKADWKRWLYLKNKFGNAGEK